MMRVGVPAVAPRPFAACCLMLLALPAGSAHPADRSDRTPSLRPNLLLVTLDTTRADHLGSYGYRLGATPRLDRLGREGVVVETAIAVAPLTLPSHATLLTGLYPPRHGARDNADFRLSESETTLAERLKQAGYRTDAVVGSIVLGGALGLSQGFDRYDEPGGTPAAGANGGDVLYQEILERRAREVTDRALARLDAVGTEPFFLWVHYFDPHASYDPPEPFRTRFAQRPYDGEIAYVDRELGRLLDHLALRGRLDNTLVVITADHGESLGEHGEATHGVFIYDATMRVPLLLRWPAKLHAGTRYRGLVSGVDVAPTILQLLELPALADAQGKSHATSLIGGAPPSPAPIYLETLYPSRAFGWAPLFALRDDKFKYIQAPTPELFELSSDPREVKNVAPKFAQRSAEWQQRLSAMQAGMGAAPSSAQQPADAERLERLRSLGYASGGDRTPSQAANPGRDPKQMIALSDRLDLARQILTPQRAAEARQIAEQVLVIDPKNPAAHGVLGLALTLQGDRPRGLTALETAASLAPEVFEHQRNLGVALLQAGRAPAACVAFRAALAIQPDAASTRFSLGAALLSAGNNVDAAVELRTAIKLGYATVGARTALAAALERGGAVDEAEAQLRTVVTANPRATPAWMQLGNLLERRGRPAEAAGCYRAAYDQLRRERPAADAYLRVVHAQWLLARGEKPAAIEELQAVLLEPGVERETAELARHLLNSNP